MTRKPLILAEVGSADPAWVRDLAAKLASGRYGMIRAVVWFDQDEWRLDANPPVLEA